LGSPFVSHWINALFFQQGIIFIISKKKIILKKTTNKQQLREDGFTQSKKPLFQKDY